MKPVCLASTLQLSPLILFTTLFSEVNPALAQVVPDNTLGTESSVVNPINENVDSIDGGAVRGQNLFHSFQEFNVGEGRGVYFSNPDAVSNIFSRVTGNNVSNILGTLGVDGAANLYLINPNGIIFGQNAALDVQGSFTATTADGIEFGDNGFFSAVAPGESLLTISVPLGLQFGSNPGNIINRSVAQNSNGETNITGGATGLQVSKGKTLGLLGGDVLLDDGNLTAKGGHIEVSSVQDEANVLLNQIDNQLKFEYSQVNSFGDINLINTAVIDVTSENGGSISVTGKNININESLINAGIIGISNNNNNQLQNITLKAQESISVFGEGSKINNNVNINSVGDGGDIQLETSNLTLSSGGEISDSIFGEGDAGNIIINAKDSITISDSNSRITSQIAPGGKGKGGDIQVTANNLTLQDSGQLFTGTFGLGDAGNLELQVADTIFLDNASSLSTQVNSLETIGNSGKLTIETGTLNIQGGSFVSSSTFGQGNANGIEIKADELIQVAGNGSQISSNVNLGAVGNGGDIQLETNNLTLSSGGGISASTFEQGDTGNIIINAKDSITISDLNSRITSQIAPGGKGKGGDIQVTANNLTLQDSGQLFTGTFGLGDAGNLELQVADTIFLNNASSLSTQVNSLETIGNSGKLTIETGTLNIQGGSFVSSSTFGQGNANSIEIRADESIQVTGNGSKINSDVNLGAVGNGGDIKLETNNLTLSNGGEISASSFGQGNAKEINIKARESIQVLGNGSKISSNVGFGASGNAGNINLSTTNLTISSFGIISASTVIGSNGGNINIDTDSIKLNSGSQISTFSGIVSSTGLEQKSGEAGRLTIRATDLIEISGENTGLITSFLGLGNAGKISLNTKKLSIRDGGGIFSSAVDFSGLFNILPNNFDLLSFINIFINLDPTLDITPLEFINNIINGENIANFKQGDSGNIFINVTELVNLDQGSIFTSGTGNALGGNVSISTPKLSLHQGIISTDTFGFGDSGTINISDAELIEITDSRLSSGTSINSQGNGGQLNIFTQDLFVKEGGIISTSTQGAGKAGELNIFASNVVDVSGINSNQSISRITAEVETVNATGDGGNLTIETPELLIKDNGVVSVATFGRGNAGNLNINAFEKINIDGLSTGLAATVLAEAIGNGGTINLSTKELNLSNRGLITAFSLGTGDAGNINLRVKNISSNNSNIVTTANRASGGEIFIDAKDISLKNNSDISTFILDGQGGGGDISITADSIVAFDDSDIFAFASEEGIGGNITLDTPAYFAENFTLNSLTTTNTRILENNNRADVNATGAVSGTVSIPDVSFIQNSLTELPNNSLDTDELVANSCVVPAGERGKGTFIITGRESLPVRPGDNPPSKYPTGEVRNVPENNDSSWQPGDPIIEPQGVYRLTNGKLVLSRECQ